MNNIMYQGDLVIIEAKLYNWKSSYKVVADRQGQLEEYSIWDGDVIFRHLIKGRTVEMLDENGNSLYVLKKEIY